jgi:four helix bundle protein
MAASRILDAARSVVDEINWLADRARPPLIEERQLRAAADSIAANVRESNGRKSDAERKQFFRYALGSAEEADERLRTNFASRRIAAATYWRIHNRLVVIRKMLERLLVR